MSILVHNLTEMSSRIMTDAVVQRLIYIQIKPVVFTARRRYAQRVLATATWLAGWLGGCPSHAGIVSKRLNLS